MNEQDGEPTTSTHRKQGAGGYAAFLQARIVEEEQFSLLVEPRTSTTIAPGVRFWHGLDLAVDVSSSSFGTASASVSVDVKRVLRDLEARRMVVRLHSGDSDRNCGQRCRDGDCPTLKALALTYVDYADYPGGRRL